MTLLIVSFIAGVLTTLAPCILPLLPVVIGSAASWRSRFTPYIVVGSLSVSIILFTYLLKASTAFIMIPPEVWTYFSGGIIILLVLSSFFLIYGKISQVFRESPLPRILLWEQAFGKKASLVTQ